MDTNIRNRWLSVITNFCVFIALSTSALAQGNERYDGPIIDMHMHVFPLSEGPGHRPCAPRPCAGPARVAKTDEEVLRLTLEMMEEHNVVLGFLSHAQSKTIDDLFEWVDAAPDRFIASPNICDPDNADLKRIEREYEAGRLTGMGEVSSQYCGLAIDDPKLADVFALADKYDVPVLVHSHGTGAPSKRFRIDIGRPSRIEEVLIRFPNMRLYIEDAGFPFLEDTIALMYRYPNVYGDLSNMTWIYSRKAFYNYFENLMDAGLGKRLMFGSDQMQWPEVIPLAVKAIESAPFLTVEQKRDIFYNNAARFLRLTEEEIAAHHDR